MKKLLVVLVVLLSISLLTGCQEKVMTSEEVGNALSENSWNTLIKVDDYGAVYSLDGKCKDEFNEDVTCVLVPSKDAINPVMIINKRGATSRFVTTPNGENGIKDIIFIHNKGKYILSEEGTYVVLNKNSCAYIVGGEVAGLEEYTECQEADITTAKDIVKDYDALAKEIGVNTKSLVNYFNEKMASSIDVVLSSVNTYTDEVLSGKGVQQFFRFETDNNLYNVSGECIDNRGNRTSCSVPSMEMNKITIDIKMSAVDFITFDGQYSVGKWNLITAMYLQLDSGNVYGLGFDGDEAFVYDSSGECFIDVDADGNKTYSSCSESDTQEGMKLISKLHEITGLSDNDIISYARWMLDEHAQNVFDSRH